MDARLTELLDRMTAPGPFPNMSCSEGHELVDLVCEMAEAPKSQTTSGQCVVDLGKVAELGQAYAQFELIRTIATQAQTRYDKHFELYDVERMGDIAKDANEIMGKLMAAFDRAK